MTHLAPELRVAVQMSNNGGDVTLQLVGELDAATAPWLLDRLPAGVVPAGRILHLDLGGLRFLDVSGVRAVLAIGDQVTRAGGQMQVQGLAGAPLRTARLLGLYQS